MKLLNARKVGKHVDNAVYVGRPTKFGSPFGEYERDEACDRFEAYFRSNKQLQAAALEELDGKDLICWCHPKRCHAETYIRFINEEKFGF